MENSRWVRGFIMSEQTYRYYCLDGAGHLHDAEWFEAENDTEAVAQVAATHPDSKCEIWQGSRLVAKIAPMTAERP